MHYATEKYVFNFENVIIRGCKWNEAVTETVCDY
jgi:hypothetical protein